MRWLSVGTVVLLTAAIGGGPRRCDAQTIAVPTFSVGKPTFSQWLQDVDVAPGTDGTFTAIWGEYHLQLINGSADHAATRQFSALSATDRAALIAFLSSL